MLFFSLFLHVTIWPNLFFWACHGKAAHPANMPDEVWSLHPKPALLPSAHIPAQLSSLLEVDAIHRHSLRVRLRHPHSNLKPVRQTRDQSFRTHFTSSHSVTGESIFSLELMLRRFKVKLNKAYVVYCAFHLFYSTKQKHIPLHYARK